MWFEIVRDNEKLIFMMINRWYDMLINTLKKYKFERELNLKKCNVNNYLKSLNFIFIKKLLSIKNKIFIQIYILKQKRFNR